MTPRRLVAAAGLLALAGLLSACMPDRPPHRAAWYADGLRGVGPPEGDFRSVAWFPVGRVDPARPADPCPLVVHLPAGPLAVADLHSPAAARRLGFRVGPRANLTTCTLETGGLRVTATFRPDDAPNHVEVAAVGGRVAEAVSVRGKGLPLPASDADLEAALGPPVGRSRWPDPDRSRR